MIIHIDNAEKEINQSIRFSQKSALTKWLSLLKKYPKKNNLMERIKKIFIKIFNPSIWVTIFALVISFSLLFIVCFYDWFEFPLVCALYVLWAYTLIIFITRLVRLSKRIKKAIQSSDKKSSKIIRRYKQDKYFHVMVGVAIGLIMSVFYVAFRLIMAIIYSSVWFYSLMGYYLVLSLLRGVILYALLKKETNEVKIYRIIAWLLLLLNSTITGIMILTIKTNSGFSYPGYVIYVSAAYAFYSLISSIVNVIKFRKIGSPILSSAKVLGLVSALVSILALQTAMISQFGEGDESFRILMNSLTGGIICTFVLALSIYMIIHSTRLKKMLHEEAHE